MRKPALIGNWKMNGSLQANQELLLRIIPGLRPFATGMDIAVCPPAPYLFQIRESLSQTRLQMGAQNVSGFRAGAHTGEMSAPMLQELGCHYVLVGHSERRLEHAESNGAVAAKFAAVLEAGMTPVLCVGETLEERQAGNTDHVIQQQLQAVVDKVALSGLGQGLVAYEPVWAIGTGEVATPSQISDVHQSIRAFLAASDPTGSAGSQLRILYGGSVKAGNALEIFSLADVDGGLIGGASLHADDFVAIGRSLAESAGLQAKNG
ncbi:triose-phosphate isomerase [Halomonadaceae bacterium KBTZ08]